MAKLPTPNSGQALLIVLLSMAVVLTIVLSVLSRSITDISITTQEGESLRAFSAAEAGVEKALLSGTAGSFSGGFDGSAFSGEVTDIGEGSSAFVFPVSVFSGETLTAWFVSHNDDGDLECSAGNPCFTGDEIKICWGKEGTAADGADTPAIEVSIFYADTPGDYSTIQVARGVYDSNAGRRSSNNFANANGGNCTIDDQNFEFSRVIGLGSLGIPGPVFNTADGLQFARLKLFYNTSITHPIGLEVVNGTTLPSQGLEIASSGTSGDSNRKINVFQSFEEIPGIFETAIFTPGGIVK